MCLVGASVCMHTCTYVYGCTRWVLRLATGNLFPSCPALYMEEVFLTRPELTNEATVPSQLAPRILWLFLKSIEITSGPPCPPDIHVRAENMTSGSHACVTSLYALSHGPSPSVWTLLYHLAAAGWHTALNQHSCWWSFFSIKHNWSLRSEQFWEVILFFFFLLDTEKRTKCSLDQKQNTFTGGKKVSLGCF